MRSPDGGNAINSSEFGECPVSEHVGMGEVVVGGQKEADRGDSSVDAVDLFFGGRSVWSPEVPLGLLSAVYACDSCHDSDAL